MARRTSVAGAAIAALMALLVAFSAPALAARPSDHGKKAHSSKSGHTQKEKGSTRGTGVTEDNDTNDEGTPNNVSDEGDNRHPSGKDRSVENGGSGNQGNSLSAPDENGHGPERDFGGTDKPDGPGGMDLADQDGNNGCGNDDDFEDDNEGWCGKNPKHDEVAPADETCAEGETMPEGEEACGDEAEEICVDDTTMDEVDETDEDTCDDEVAPAEEICVEDTTMDEVDETDEACGDESGEATEEDVTLPADDVQNDTETFAPVSDVPTADVLGLVIERSPGDSPEVLGERLRSAAAERAALPFTGGDVLPLILIGAGLMITGFAASRIRREER
ncbi:MAG: hypothetical protein QOH26_1424 [Actinomycetota bacterium]|nr:hypothetical protein [Actinomycetota bacterium]